MNRRGPRRGRCLSCGRAVWLCAGTELMPTSTVMAGKER